MSDFITNGAAVLPAVKSDVRVATGGVGEWAADDCNGLRQALLDLRSAILPITTPFYIYDLAMFHSDVPGGSAVMGRWVMARTVAFPANLAGSRVRAGVAATASTVLTLKKNGASVGTLTFAAAGTVPTMAGASWSVVADDIVTIENQATADATLAAISITLAGERTA